MVLGHVTICNHELAELFAIPKLVAKRPRRFDGCILRESKAKALYSCSRAPVQFGANHLNCGLRVRPEVVGRKISALAIPSRVLNERRSFFEGNIEFKR